MAPTPTRRGFLGELAATASSLLLSTRPAAASDAGAASGKRHKWGMVIDLDRCTGCQACAVACRAENNVPVAGAVHTEKGRSIFWMNQLKRSEGAYPDLRQQFLPAPCNHCEDPPCIKVCPVGATTQSDEGITQQIPERCIGCRLCEVSCPYTRRYFNWSEPEWPDSLREQLNPDVAVRPHGVIEKCLFCHHRIRKVKDEARAEGRPVTDEDVRRLPACAETCPAEAIVFGDLNDPESEVSRLRESPRAFRLLEELGTHPKVIYLREAKWQE
jgi:molybdopterin-containing oxidoreductase family iron-sulfur binding subunit